MMLEDNLNIWTQNAYDDCIATGKLPVEYGEPFGVYLYDHKIDDKKNIVIYIDEYKDKLKIFSACFDSSDNEVVDLYNLKVNPLTLDQIFEIDVDGVKWQVKLNPEGTEVPC